MGHHPAADLKQWQEHFKSREAELIPNDVVFSKFPRFNFSNPQFHYEDEYRRFPQQPRQLQAALSGYEVHPIPFIMPELTPYQFALATFLSESVMVGDYYASEAAYNKMRGTSPQFDYWKKSPESHTESRAAQAVAGRHRRRPAAAVGPSRSTMPAKLVGQQPPSDKSSAGMFAHANRLDPRNAATYINRAIGAGGGRSANVGSIRMPTREAMMTAMRAATATGPDPTNVLVEPLNEPPVPVLPVPVPPRLQTPTRPSQAPQRHTVGSSSSSSGSGFNGARRVSDFGRHVAMAHKSMLEKQQSTNSSGAGGTIPLRHPAARHN